MKANVGNMQRNSAGTERIVETDTLARSLAPLATTPYFRLSLMPREDKPLEGTQRGKSCFEHVPSETQAVLRSWHSTWMRGIRRLSEAIHPAMFFREG